jgi:hypothetical protein
LIADLTDWTALSGLFLWIFDFVISFDRLISRLMILMWVWLMWITQEAPG